MPKNVVETENDVAPESVRVQVQKNAEGFIRETEKSAPTLKFSLGDKLKKFQTK